MRHCVPGGPVGDSRALMDDPWPRKRFASDEEWRAPSAGLSIRMQGGEGEGMRGQHTGVNTPMADKPGR